MLAKTGTGNVAAFRIVTVPALCRQIEFSVVPTSTQHARISFRFVSGAPSALGRLSVLLQRTLDQINPPDAEASYGSDKDNRLTKEFVIFFIPRFQAEEIAKYFLQTIAKSFGGM